MPVTVNDIIEVMAALAPPVLAESWDNVGLQIGRKDWPVKKLWVALDPLFNVVYSACNQEVDLLITHHPLFFKPINTIDLATPTGSIIHKAVEHQLAIFSAHTNLDSVNGGINDILASIIGLSNLGILAEANEFMNKIHGLGRIGDLAGTILLSDLVIDLKAKLSISSVRVAGNLDLPVKRVALCSGSGSSLLEKFFSSGAQVYITGDVRYHDARMIEEKGLACIDIGHFASEHIIVKSLAESLGNILESKNMDVMVEAFTKEQEPFILL
ncbi:GTP cyclohydrolase I [Candidatus Magnetomoraceae bacterium gMMP-1]